jgi:hypothetical protein
MSAILALSASQGTGLPKPFFSEKGFATGKQDDTSRQAALVRY